jgi:hypothetical protein
VFAIKIPDIVVVPFILVEIPLVPIVTDPPLNMVVPINIPVVRLYALIMFEVIPDIKFWVPDQLFELLFI